MPGPLHAVRIIDLSAQISGPLATAMLGDQGADVIKVEPPEGGDSFRFMGPARGGIAASFLTINRSKRFLALDIKSEAGKSVLCDLIRGADVLVQNFRAGVIERLGFSFEDVQKINPALIMVSISGFGAQGPYKNRKAYDTIVQAVSGIATMQADRHSGEPRLIQGAICDKTTALVAAQAISAALFARERDPARRGQHVELSMLGTAIWFGWNEGMYNHVFAEPDSAPFPEVSAYPLLFHAKGGSLGLNLVSQDEFNRACACLERPDLATDPRFASPRARFEHVDTLEQVLAPIIAGFEVEELCARLMAEDVPVAKVNRRQEVLADPHVVAQGLILRQAHPLAGSVRQPRPPAAFSAQPLPEPGPAGKLGEHSLEILRELGYSAERIAQLDAGGAVRLR